jgi:hypothetical protein
MKNQQIGRAVKAAMGGLAEVQEVPEPIGNPLDPEAQITLKDGIARTFRFGFHEAYLFEISVGKPFLEALALPNTLAKIRMLLFSGLHADFARRGERLTYELLGGLLPIRAKELGVIVEKMQWVIDASLMGPSDAGGSLASSVKTLKAKRDRGRGLKH